MGYRYLAWNFDDNDKLGGALFEPSFKHNSNIAMMGHLEIGVINLLTSVNIVCIRRIWLILNVI